MEAITWIQGEWREDEQKDTSLRAHNMPADLKNISQYEKSHSGPQEQIHSRRSSFVYLASDQILTPSEATLLSS